MPDESPLPPCPACAATHVVRNGFGKHRKQQYRCMPCGRRFVADPAKGPVPDATRALIVRLLGERLSLRAITRVTGVARSWLQRFVNARYRADTRWRVELPPAPPVKKKSRS